MTVRTIKPGEMLALDPSRLHRGPEGFFWMMTDPPKPNERIGDVAIVHVRGELEHHASPYGCESYEGILTKFAAAIDGRVEDETLEGDEPEACPPTTVITCIDSPGGVVAGLNSTVRALQAMRAEHPEIQFWVYVNEMAASAAYALACGMGARIMAPRDSAIVGSIGVISTMISQARKNEKDGYDVVLLTSGARKADGHAHAPLSDKAKEVEQGRVDKLAAAFFKLASKARGIPIAKIRSFEAGIFLSKDAMMRGLVDEIMPFADVLLAASGEQTEDSTVAGGNKTDRKAEKHATQSSTSHRSDDMQVSLAALIKKTEAAMAKETDKKKRAALAANLEAYKKTKHTIEKHEEESGDEEDEEEEASEESNEESEESEEDLPPKKDDDEDDDEDDEDDDEEESEEEATSEDDDAKAALALVQQLTGMTGKRALGAIQALAATAANTAKDVADLKRKQRGQEKATLINDARGKFLTKKEAAWLATQLTATVRGFVEMRRKAGVIVHTDETTIVRPRHVEPGSEESLPKETLDMIEASVAGFPGDKKAFREQLVKAHLDSHKQQLQRAMNGAGRI